MTETKPEWICPKCNVSNDPDFTRCRICGEPNPNSPPGGKKCAKCGALAGEHTCCPVCGSDYFLNL